MKTLFNKTQTMLLKLFVANPDKAYYIQEVGKILEKKPGVFQRDLYALEEIEILTSYYQGGARYFQINKNYPVYQEIKNIINKTVGIGAVLKKLLSKFDRIKVSFMFGSVAQQEFDQDSDVDLMVVGQIDEDELLKKISLAEKNIHREINYHIYSVKDWQKKVKNKDSFILNLIRRSKIFLVGNQDVLSRLS